MAYAIMYSKEGGNTRALADQVKKVFTRPCYFGLLDKEGLKADIIFLGFWTDEGTCDPNTKDFIKQMKGKKVFSFGSAGFGGEEYQLQIIERVNDLLLENNQVIGNFVCQGKMPYTVKERYLKQKESGIFVPNLDILIKNFDEALDHPNQDDFNNLKEKLLLLKA